VGRRVLDAPAPLRATPRCGWWWSGS
jgi:hypothetical protein